MADRVRRWNVVRFFLTTVYLLAGWILFTWSLDPVRVATGLAVSLIVASFTWSIFIEDHDVARRSQFPRPHTLVVYIGVLIFQMYVSSFKVLWRIVRGKINPGVVHFRTRLRSDVARVVLSSSITLTPGTITLLLDDDHLIVHWLHAKTTHSRYARKLIAQPFEELLRRIWI